MDYVKPVTRASFPEVTSVIYNISLLVWQETSIFLTVLLLSLFDPVREPGLRAAVVSW